MTLQLVIVRTAADGFRIIEMGYGQGGKGETLREHVIGPEIGPTLAGKYIAELLSFLVKVEGAR